MTREEAVKAMRAGRMVWHDTLDCWVDITRVFGKTATVQGWGKGLREGKLVCYRGQPLSELRAHKMIECEECGGTGRVEARCVDCGEILAPGVESKEDDERCSACADDEESGS